MPVPQPEPRGYAGNLGVLFAERAQETRTALVDLRQPASARELSFAALDALCNAVARGLTRAGLAAGDRIAIVSLNRHEFVATVLGAMRAGIVPVPINVKLAAESVRFIAEDAGAKVMFCEHALRPLCPPELRTIEFDGAAADAFERFLDPGPFTAFEPAPDAIAIQPYTSGSTGRPKGVLLTHYGQNWSRRILAHTRGTTERDVILVAAPLYHKNALNAIKQGLTAGALLVLLPQFNVERYIEAIGRYHATVISGVPTMMSMLLARADLLKRIDTSSVRTVMMGSAPSSARLLEQLRAAFPNAEPLVVYGVTEGGPVPLGPHPDGRAAAVRFDWRAVCRNGGAARRRAGRERGRAHRAQSRHPARHITTCPKNRRDGSAMAGITPATSAAATRTVSTTSSDVTTTCSSRVARTSFPSKSNRCSSGTRPCTRRM